VRLDPVAGAVGDRWAASLLPKIDAQVTLMRADVARLLGEPASFGDNLLVTLDTGAANLPPGTVLRVGSARCVVTPKPHTGCSRFGRRASDGARAVLASPAWRTCQLRGVHLRVLEAGDVGVGDLVSVESRP
jgi:MOSC domain-containing protein YiiM